jgi:hypothetical protein
MEFQRELKRKKLTTILFVASAVVSLLLVMPQIANYAEFYRAIEKFDFLLVDVTMDDSGINEGRIYVTVEFNGTNPTSFTGLTISTITCHLHYLREDQTSPQALLGVTQSFTSEPQFNPSQTVIMKINFTLVYPGLDQIRLFISYLQTKPDKVDWMVTGQYVLEAYAYAFAMQMDYFTYSMNLR